MKRNFDEWFSTFQKNIYGYSYYVDFEKVYANANALKVELNILNSLIGERDIENAFLRIAKKYPDTLKCIPILLAVREDKIEIYQNFENFVFDFNRMNYPVEKYAKFMRESGLFDLLKSHLIANLYDYVTGVEVGLDSNARKNRGGKTMEAIIAGYLSSLPYYVERELKTSIIESMWNVDLSALSNSGTTEKRFDFVVKTDNMIYLIETNFYKESGSKLNETARSYKQLYLESCEIPEVTFIWFTDGAGWVSARRNLRETFDVMPHIYNLNDLKNGILKKIIK